MTHVDYFKEFFKTGNGKGTAKDICGFLTDRKASFKCNSKRKPVSVNSHLRRELRKNYPTGIVSREKNTDGVYEYFTK